MAGGRTWAALDRAVRRAAAGPAGQLQMPRGFCPPVARLSRPRNSRCGDGGQELWTSIFPSGSVVGREYVFGGGPMCRFLATFGRVNLPEDTCHQISHKNYTRRSLIPASTQSYFDLDASSSCFSPSLSSLSPSPSSPVLLQDAAGIAASYARMRRKAYLQTGRLVPTQALGVVAIDGGGAQSPVWTGAKSLHVSSSYSSSASAGSNQTPAADREAGKEGEGRAGEKSSAAEGGGEAGGTQSAAAGGGMDADELKKEDLIALIMDREKQVREKEEMIASLKNSLLLAYADMENLRERTRREIDSIRKFAVQGFAKSLLDVADNLGRALSVVHAELEKGEGSAEAAAGSLPAGSAPVKLLRDFVMGVEMTEKQLLKCFRQFEIEKYDPIGEEFNPNEHQAMFEVPGSEQEEKAGKVAVVTKEGYKMHGRVLRPAEVGVYRKSAAATD